MLDGHADAESVISEADSALYQAKHRGKGRLEVFDRELQAAVAHQTELELALRRAIPNGELTLHLQPIIDLRTNRIDGAEALVRWEHQTLGLVAPSDFIPLAERSSLIIDLDRWVIERCCERLAAWRRERPGTQLRLAVNISGRHLMEGNLVNDVAAALARTGADPSMLEIELTETHLLGDLERAVASLTALRERGVRVSIDDFGTGYSAMNYLRRLPIDAIKIDRSFVVAATSNASDASVVDAVMAIGRSHGLEVVAEGIETIEHLDFVRERGRNRAAGLPDRAPGAGRRGRAAAARAGTRQRRLTASDANGSSAAGSFSAPRLATWSGSAPSRIFLTGSSSFLPLNVVGIAAIWWISSGTWRGESPVRNPSRMRRRTGSSGASPSASPPPNTTNSTSVPGSSASDDSRCTTRLSTTPSIASTTR